MLKLHGRINSFQCSQRLSTAPFFKSTSLNTAGTQGLLSRRDERQVTALHGGNLVSALLLANYCYYSTFSCSPVGVYLKICVYKVLLVATRNACVVAWVNKLMEEAHYLNHSASTFWYSCHAMKVHRYYWKVCWQLNDANLLIYLQRRLFGIVVNLNNSKPPDTLKFGTHRPRPSNNRLKIHKGSMKF